MCKRSSIILITEQKVVDEETQSEVDTKRLSYDWEKVSRIDHQARPPLFVFNSGQWFGTAGVLTRDDFSPWLEWIFTQCSEPEAGRPRAWSSGTRT